MWTFESVIDKEGFINNRFFWDDCFEAMNNWSDDFHSYFITTWINCEGTPLNFWSDSFFFKVGWMIGEPLLIDEDTSKKKRLDKGRILVLVNKFVSVSSKIAVKAGNISFQISLKEDDNPAD